MCGVRRIAAPVLSLAVGLGEVLVVLGARPTQVICWALVVVSMSLYVSICSLMCALCCPVRLHFSQPPRPVSLCASPWA